MKIEHLLVVGVGLIGGSLALALRRAGVVNRVSGLGRSRENLERALALGVIDDIASGSACARDADVVFLGVPVGAMETVLASLAPHIAERAVVTDGGSTKRGPIAAARAALGPGFARFVPGHPIAGSEKSGAEAARADLFDNHRVLLTPQAETAADAVDLVIWMWRQAGASVTTMDAADHDRVLGLTSHLPHLLAFTLVDFIARRADAECCFDLAAGGFFDFTRIASSDPVMWRDISIDNADTLSAAVGEFIGALEQVRAMVDEGRGAELESLFRHARDARDRVVDQRRRTGS